MPGIFLLSQDIFRSDLFQWSHVFTAWVFGSSPAAMPGCEMAPRCKLN